MKSSPRPFRRPTSILNFNFQIINVIHCQDRGLRSSGLFEISVNVDKFTCERVKVDAVAEDERARKMKA